MKFREVVRREDPSIEHIPAGFQRYGDTMILRSSHNLSQNLGGTIVDLYPWCNSVYQHITTTGEARKPFLVHLGGIDNPEVVHKENGVTYVLDLSKITFSGGNNFLRERLVKEISSEEFLLDMFAAVGNLSMQPLVHKEISAILIEKNPYTFSYLQKTVNINNISSVELLNMDCRELQRKDIADRIYMGYHEVDRSHLKPAIQAAKPGAKLHLHPLVKVEKKKETIERYSTMITDLGANTKLVKKTRVKDYAPGIEHIELVFQLDL